MVPKVASSSITRALKINPQRSAFPEEEGNEFRFMVVRHPLDRLVSMWTFFCKDHDRIESNGIGELGYYWYMPFSEFLDNAFEKYDLNQHSQKQVDLKGPHNIDFLVKLENLQKYWPELQKKFSGLQSLGHFHKTDHKPWTEYYTPEYRKKSEEVFSEDIALYEGAK